LLTLASPTGLFGIGALVNERFRDGFQVIVRAPGNISKTLRLPRINMNASFIAMRASTM